MEEHLPLTLVDEKLIECIKWARAHFIYSQYSAAVGAEEVHFYVQFTPDKDWTRNNIHSICSRLHEHFPDLNSRLDYKIWIFPDHLPNGAFSLNVRNMTQTFQKRREACREFACLLLSVAPFCLKELNRHLAWVIWETREEEQWGAARKLTTQDLRRYRIGRSYQ